MLFCSVEKCKNVNFGIDKITRLPYCAFHQGKRTDLDRRSIIHKAIAKRDKASTQLRSLQNTSENKTLALRHEQVKESAMTLYYIKRMSEVKPICDNCGAKAEWILQPKFYKLWKSAQAHILEKRHFKSIETNPLNFLTLFADYSGVCDCHDRYDRNWRSASSMDIWPTVIERFKILYPLIKPEEHQFIPKQLLDIL